MRLRAPWSWSHDLSDVRVNVPATGPMTGAMGGTMSARASNSIHSVVNARGEKIEVGFIVTVIEEEHVYGTGEIKAIRGEPGRPHFARVLWEDPAPGGYEWSYLHVDEL